MIMILLNAMWSQKRLSLMCLTWLKMYKNLNLRKEVGIAIKSKETSIQLELVRKSYVASYNASAFNY